MKINPNLPSILAASRFWEQPELTGSNRLPSRATLPIHLNAEDALAQKNIQSICLDGTWDFCLVDTPYDTPDQFIDGDFNDSSWHKLPVPGLWTMHGFDTPQYTNWRLPL